MRSMERDMRFFLAGLAGAGAMTALAVAFPNVTRFATIPLAIVCIIFSLYCLLPELKKFHGGRRFKLIPLIGMVACGAGFVGFATAFFWTVPRSTATTAALSADAVAHLAALGWTIKPDPISTQFQIASASLPDMKQSAAYFKQFGKPFNLQFQQVNSLVGLHYLADVPNCTAIQINAGQFTDLSELSGFVHLENLGISQLPLNGTDVVDITPLKGLVGLKQLNLGMVRTRSIAPLTYLNGITSLYLGQTLINDISALSGFKNLSSLDISGTRVTNLTPLAGDQNLVELTISGPQVPGVSALTQLKNLKTITINEQQPFSLSALGALINLNSLTLLIGQAPIDLGPIVTLTNLHTLLITGLGFGFLTPVQNPQVIGSLTGLNELSLGNLQISDLSFLATLSNLNSIGLTNMPVSSISFLQGLGSLQKISLVDVPVVDVSPLLTLPALTGLTVGRVPARQDVISALEKNGVAVTAW